jgi:hypothetical protein
VFQHSQLRVVIADVPVQTSIFASFAVRLQEIIGLYFGNNSMKFLKPNFPLLQESIFHILIFRTIEKLQQQSFKHQELFCMLKSASMKVNSREFLAFCSLNIVKYPSLIISAVTKQRYIKRVSPSFHEFYVREGTNTIQLAVTFV